MAGIVFRALSDLKPGGLDPYLAAAQSYYRTSFKSWNFWDVVCLIVLVLLRHDVYKSRDIQSISNRYSFSVITLFFWVQFTLDTAVLPDVLNRKSDYTLAQQVKDAVPEGPIYSYIGSPMMRFFVINFYTQNRVVDFESHLPQEGYLIVGESEYAGFAARHTDHTFDKMWKSPHRGNASSDIVCLYRVNRKHESEGQSA